MTDLSIKCWYNCNTKNNIYLITFNYNGLNWEVSGNGNSLLDAKQDATSKINKLLELLSEKI